MKRYRKLICVAICLTLSASCRKFVGVPPPVTQVSNTSLFLNNAAVESALGGIYVSMEGNSVGGGEDGISALLGLSADDFNLLPGSQSTLSQVYMNQQTSSNAPGIWSNMYNLIYQANELISGTNSSSSITTQGKQQVIGEAEFIRAFCNFYLLNIYGNIPLVTTIDYNKNATLKQSSTEEVYAQIVTDLEDAKSRLGQNYLDLQGNVTSERVRPNMFVATALLARVYLYMDEYDSAEQEASTIINNSLYFLHRDLDSVFLTTSQEAIWQLELPSTAVNNTPDGQLFLPGLLYFGGPTTSAPFTLNDSLIASFEPNDLRRIKWMDSINTGATTYFFPYKYKACYTLVPPVEYPMVMRLAEQFLIRSESRVQQGKLSGALEDLNIIRDRADLPAYAGAMDRASLLSAILHERRVELFTEYGQRWLDLKRAGMVDQVMTIATPLKGGFVWQSKDSLYPIPYSDIQSDYNLKQNSGY